LLVIFKENLHRSMCAGDSVSSNLPVRVITSDVLLTYIRNIPARLSESGVMTRGWVKDCYWSTWSWMLTVC